METQWMLGILLVGLLSYYLFFVVRNYKAKTHLEFDSLVHRFRHLLQAGNKVEAYALVEKLVTLPARQNLWYWYFQRALMYYNEGRYNNALADITAAINVKKNDFDLYYLRFTILFYLEDDDALYADAKLMVDLEPKAAISELCYLYALSRKQFENSETILNRVEASKNLKVWTGTFLNDFDPSQYHNLAGHCYLLNNSPQKAIEYYQQTLTNDSNNSDALWGMAEISLEKEDFESASIFCQRALIHKRSNTLALNCYAKTYLKLNNRTFAEEQYIISARFGNKNAQKWLAEYGVLN